jgi:hypothetical protein
MTDSVSEDSRPEGQGLTRALAQGKGIFQPPNPVKDCTLV